VIKNSVPFLAGFTVESRYSDLNVLRVMIDRRTKIQDASLQLLDVIENASLEESDKNVCQLLSACSFSLWRAAFLLDIERKDERVLNNARLFLRKVLTDNAITFQTDRERREWSVGYYLNNAK
jgi:hypothetical protein